MAKYIILHKSYGKAKLLLFYLWTLSIVDNYIKNLYLTNENLNY